MYVKEKSKLLHSTSEHTGYIKKLVDGKASVEGYTEYIFNLGMIYSSLENSLNNNKSNSTITPFVTPKLYKSELIKKDLEFLSNNTLFIPLSSTEAYISRLNEISKNKPELIIAHTYTRFLADLFGGRTFFSILNSKYKISPEGLNYYKFDGIEDFKIYIDEYRGKLNSLILSEEVQREFLNEVYNAYIYNLAISNELDYKLNN